MAKKVKVEGRIRYEADYMGRGEHYIFEFKKTTDKEWKMEKAFGLIQGELVHYTALTTLREWQRLGIEFHFGE